MSIRIYHWGPHFEKCLGKSVHGTLGLHESIWQLPQIAEPQYRPQNTVVAIMETPTKSTPNFEKAPFASRASLMESSSVRKYIFRPSEDFPASMKDSPGKRREKCRKTSGVGFSCSVKDFIFNVPCT